MILGHGKDRRPGGLLDMPGQQVFVESGAIGPAEGERVARRAGRRVGPAGEDQTEVVRALPECSTDRRPGAVGELVVGVEDDPDLGATGQVLQGAQHLLGEEVELLPGREGDGPLELGDRRYKARDGAAELSLQILGETPLIGRLAEDDNGVDIALRDEAVGQLGPGEG